MKESEVLKRAKALIATRKQWTTKAFARTANGYACWRLDEKAVCFCALGAAGRAQRDIDPSFQTTIHVESLLHEATRMLYLSVHTAGVNDRLGFDAVHAVYDLAITLAEEREQAEALRTYFATRYSCGNDAAALGHE